MAHGPTVARCGRARQRAGISAHAEPEEPASSIGQPVVDRASPRSGVVTVGITRAVLWVMSHVTEGGKARRGGPFAERRTHRSMRALAIAGVAGQVAAQALEIQSRSPSWPARRRAPRTRRRS